jgi:hypothetical protein
MKSKTLLMAVLLGAALVPEVRALGLGVQLNFSAGGIFAPGAALAISPSETTHLAVNWYLGLDEDKTNTIGLTLDVIPLVLPISSFSAGSFNFTLGGGLFANLAFGADIGFDGGVRIPLGLNLKLGRDALELYTHVAPSFGLRALPSLGISDPFFPVALGVRLGCR